MEDITDLAKGFCVEQCHYAQRGMTHKEDAFRLAFASVIYCLYSQHVDRDLCLVITETLESAQQENGNWPALHPIFRENKGPWHIASHEIALCLTWLYFQPRMPDKARPALLRMMRKYFTNWVVPTFIRVPKTDNDNSFEGWYDDHIIASDNVVGWATAIVCHFLANYHSVLDDHINRRVIEVLNLQPFAREYLIDETAHEHSTKWSISESQIGKRAMWPDLPPYAWSYEIPEELEVAKRIQWEWTDPSLKAQYSRALAKMVLLPIFKLPGARLDGELFAGMLSGKPGTRKTSLVKAIAKVIRWPVVTVPASVIFDDGFDMMEARANEVFRKLTHLKECIIFFDEFEEFFKDRGVGESPIHDRTIAAFTTSAMLPRLQDLHDEARCLIFLATNHPDRIDEAIMRPGRFDFQLEIDHPIRERIIEYSKNPTRKTLKKSKFDVCDSEMGLKKGQCEDFNTRRKQVEIALMDVFGPEEEVRFTYFEEALETVVKCHDDKTKKVDEKVVIAKAKSKLQDCRKRAVASGREPPNLVDL